MLQELGLLAPALLALVFGLNGTLGWVLRSLARDCVATGRAQAALGSTVVALLAFAELISRSGKLPRGAWPDIGVSSWLLVWAALFAPWFLLSYWQPCDSGRGSPVRAILLPLGIAGVGGWLYLLAPWLL